MPDVTQIGVDSLTPVHDLVLMAMRLGIQPAVCEIFRGKAVRTDMAVRVDYGNASIVGLDKCRGRNLNLWVDDNNRGHYFTFSFAFSASIFCLISGTILKIDMT